MEEEMLSGWISTNERECWVEESRRMRPIRQRTEQTVVDISENKSHSVKRKAKREKSVNSESISSARL